jgi:hypothetical protein
MSPNEYLKKILQQQTFGEEDQELVDLRQRRKDIEKLLRSHFSTASPRIRVAGSMAKDTMIRDSYDLDIACYFARDDDEAGTTLEEIYNNTVEALSRDYQVQRKPSAIRVLDAKKADLHVDVVAGRFTDESEGDVFLHRTTGEKERLKTNLQVHIDHIRESGCVDAIRLMKLWKVRNGLDSAKTFVLELLVVKLLAEKKGQSVSKQLEHIWREFRDNADSLAVEDPANSNNILKPALDICRTQLATVAKDTLWQIENGTTETAGWTKVFGPLDHDDGTKNSGVAPTRIDSLRTAVASVVTPTKPWCEGR